jgi:hypothetical protein
MVAIAEEEQGNESPAKDEEQRRHNDGHLVRARWGWFWACAIGGGGVAQAQWVACGRKCFTRDKQRLGFILLRLQIQIAAAG